MTLAHLNYPQLVKIRQDLYTHVPSDPTFMAAAGVLLRAWVDELLPDAKERHDADQKAANEQIISDLKARAKDGDENAKAELTQREAALAAEVEAQKRLADQMEQQADRSDTAVKERAAEAGVGTRSRR